MCFWKSKFDFSDTSREEMEYPFILDRRQEGYLIKGVLTLESLCLGTLLDL